MSGVAIIDHAGPIPARARTTHTWWIEIGSTAPRASTATGPLVRSAPLVGTLVADEVAPGDGPLARAVERDHSGVSRLARSSRTGRPT